MKRYGPHLFVAGALAVVWLTGAGAALRTALEDVRPGWFQRDATKEVVVIAIDAPSLRQIGYWPWPRSLHAELIDKLLAAGAGDIAFDIDLSSPSDKAADAAFLDALNRAGGSVLLPAFKQVVRDNEGKNTDFVNRPLASFADKAWTTLVNVIAEPDGAVRRYPYGGRLDDSEVPSMAALLAGGRSIGEGSFWLDFSIRADTIPVVSYVDVFRGESAALAQFKGKKVIVGGTALELGDRFVLPKGRIMSGPVLQALAA